MEELIHALRSIDYWFERYQTLLTGLLAGAAAFQAVRIAKQQKAIMTDQVKITQTQQEQTIAVAKLTVRRFLDEIGKIREMQVFQCPVNMTITGDPDPYYLSNASWEEGIELPPVSYDGDEVLDAVAVAYPDRIERMHDLVRALRTLQVQNSLGVQRVRSAGEKTYAPQDNGPVPTANKAHDKAWNEFMNIFDKLEWR